MTEDMTTSTRTAYKMTEDMAQHQLGHEGIQDDRRHGTTSTRTEDMAQHQLGHEGIQDDGTTSTRT